MYTVSRIFGSWCCLRCMYYLNRLSAKKHANIQHNKLPWFWIGARFKNKTVSITELLNYTVRNGDRVNIAYLSALTNYEDVVAWVYIDPKTLEEKEIDSKGIVINVD